MKCLQFHGPPETFLAEVLLGSTVRLRDAEVPEITDWEY